MPNPRPPVLLTLPAVVLLAALFAGVRAQGPASSPGQMPAPLGPMPTSPGPMPASMDCSTPLLNMSDCLTFVEAGSNLTVPDKGCCPGLAGLIDSNPVCLCQLLGSGEALGLPIDTAKALKLPPACHVSTPPVSLCAVLGIPVASPMGAASAPITGGPSPLSGGTETPGSSIAPSKNHGSSTCRAFDIVRIVGLSCAGIISLAVF